ncbi:MAG: cytochrome c oxidase subunit 3 [Gammaproteobacteria bacterium]|nr:MAG: cytochrome c oxidase subunit 3 [Gammaproteobacteria bacterium]
MAHAQGDYYIPNGTNWPILGSIGLTLILSGFAVLLNEIAAGKWMMILGALVFIYMLFGWFGTVIHESQAGTYNSQVDFSFRLGMGWFIFSEVMFFAVFFGVLFYARVLSVPWLAGEGDGVMTHAVLWSNFIGEWPLLNNPDPEMFKSPEGIIPAWGIPAINTVILLSSGVTVTLAHWALKEQKRSALQLWLLATVILGFLFVYLQAIEYIHAYKELNLTLGSGIYGSTFFMLTGFHGLHVTLGATMLVVILIRVFKGHFTPDNHFAFEAVAWYWHFVDVVWLGLFIFVYWI